MRPQAERGGTAKMSEPSRQFNALWVVYCRPIDFPSTVAGAVPTPDVLTAETLAALRDAAPAGLVTLDRSPGDDPVIVECWV